jgi:hypothetical protein
MGQRDPYAERVMCWWCGVEPDSVDEIMQFGGQVIALIPDWPAGDHVHAERAPSPAQLQDAGHRALMRLRDEASES